MGSPRASVVDNFAACLLVERLIATLQIKIVNDFEFGSDESHDTSNTRKVRRLYQHRNMFLKLF